MDEIDEKARKQNEELWLFFDEINTCLSLSLLTEIFINRAYYGKSISDNILLNVASYVFFILRIIMIFIIF